MSRPLDVVGVSGPGSNTLIITKLARGGAQVTEGDLLVEFDRQNQLKAAFDKRAEYLDFEEQIRKKRAEQEQARAKRRCGAGAGGRMPSRRRGSR